MTEPRARGAPDANERSEDKPGASYIWALVIGSMTKGICRYGNLAFAVTNCCKALHSRHC
jgi:hypothetical protein